MGRPFLFMADAHVKGRTWTNCAALRGDAYAALDLVASKLDGLPSGRRPDTLVIGGDWFDSNRPTSEDVLRTFSFLRRFSRVLYVRGNHDCAEPSYLEADRTVPGHCVKCLDGAVEPLGASSSVTGASWRPSAESLGGWMGSVRESAPEGLLFVVVHAPSRHLLGFDGSWQLDVAALPEALLSTRTAILAGDIHVRDFRRLTDTCTFHSPGSLYPLSWDRAGSPCCVSLVDPDDGSVEDLPCDVRLYREIEFAGMPGLCRDLEELAEGNPLPLPPFVRVQLGGASGYVPSELPPGVVVQAADDALEASSPAAQGVAACSMEDAVRAECEADPELADMASALLAADDPLAEMESWLDYWKVERICEKENGHARRR